MKVHAILVKLTHLGRKIVREPRGGGSFTLKLRGNRICKEDCLNPLYVH